MVAPALMASVVSPLSGATYLTVEQAQKAIFPNSRLQPVERLLSQEERRLIETRSGVKVRNPKLNLWKTENGEWFIVDEVLGKHEFITFALGLDAQGKVLQVEVMDYRETYGFEVRNEAWRRQFQGRKDGDALKLDQDIKNISGATLSCRHITDGVKRLLATHAVALHR